MEKDLLVQPLGGLCNRMRVIVGAVSLAYKTGRQLTIIWTQDTTLNSKFSDLFEPIPFRVIECSLNSWRYKFLYHWYKDVKHSMILDDTWISTNARGKEYDTWKNKIEDRHLFLQTNLDILFDGDYSLLKPRMSVINALNNVECNQNTIGLHIRRTDNVKAVKYSPTRLFFAKVEEELKANPQKKFYLATDDPNEERAFIDKFGGNIIIYQKHSLDRNNPIAIKDALIDLYNLSCCSKIYGSYWSSFSDTAALWSGIEKIELKVTYD